MKMKAYAVFDIKAQVFTQPFFQLNDAVAQRIIQNAANSEGHNYNLNPEDFELWCIGEYNDQDGLLTPSKSKILDVATLIKQPRLPLDTNPSNGLEAKDLQI